MIHPYYQDDSVTIYHGDCRDVLSTLAADDLTVVSDVPYGRALRSSRNGAHGDCRIENDTDTALRDWLIAWASERDVPCILFGSPAVARPVGLTADRVLIWDKGDHVGMGDLSWPWKPNYEEIYILGEGFAGPRTSSVLRFHAIAGTVAVTQGRTHPTEKPVPLLRSLVLKCPGVLILDPFMGTGSALLAAKSVGRRAIGVELRERYCEIAANRMSQTVMAFDAA